MKQLILPILVLVNYAFSSVAFLVFLNWYDTGQLDFDGWQYMVIGGLVIGFVLAFLENRAYHRRGLQTESIYSFLFRHLLINELGLIGSFALGYAADLILDVRDLTQVISILPMLLIIPLMAMFYSIMMIPFGIYLGITNGLLFSLANKSRQ